MLAIIIISALVAIDQVAKYFAYTHLRDVGSIALTSFFSLTYLENRGAAFGMLYGGRWFFVIFTIIVMVLLFKYYKSLPNDKINKYLKASIIILSAGAIGNFIDRLLFGFVIDYFHITAFNFPIFNFADVLIVCGAVMYGALTVFFIKE